tara:strand:- start:60 stop:566 length:507 start_codon:yes stop_codon:yes gene_type:complete
MKEEWRNIVVDGKVYGGYSVSNYGNIITHKKQVGGNIGWCFDPNYKKIKKARRQNRGMSVSLTFPKDFFEYDYRITGSSKNSITRDRRVHQIVMETFCPIDENPPVSMQEWEQTPKSIKKIVRECIFINHKDHDFTNNRLDNLEYVTPRQNTRKAVEHYGKHHWCHSK